MSSRRPIPRFPRTRISPTKPPSILSSPCLYFLAFLVGLLAGVIARGRWMHAGIVRARAEPRPPVAAAVRPHERPLRVVLLSSAYSGSGGGGDAGRADERARVVAKNAALRSVAAVHLLHAGGDVAVVDAVERAVAAVVDPAPVVFDEMPRAEPLTYGTLFEYANRKLAGRVVVLANADVYFDESVACTGLLRAGRGVALSLTRHPSPDCVAGSGHGDTAWEPQDLCAAYHPVSQASHDVFAFVAPLPNAFVAALRDLRVNQFGAENVVLWNLRRFAHVEPLNPCANVHAFHAHCNAQMRGASAHQRTGNEGDRRREFGATTRYGFLDPSLWGGQDAAGVDCLLLGLSSPPRNRKLAPVGPRLAPSLRFGNASRRA